MSDAGGDGQASAGARGGGPALRVTTLELFFDLVFAFTLTQLAAVLDAGLSAGAVVRVLLMFGLLWWMYGGGYAWLTNARPPVHAAEQLPLLAGMAGFLIIGLAIPHAFGTAGVVLGLGYLLVVVVHSILYYQVNTQIIRIAPVNLASALLIIVAGVAGGPARYPLWVAALAIQLGSPLVVNPRGRFELNASHLSERYSALLIVALGESVAAIGIGAAHRPAATSAATIAAAVAGLALAAGLWWIIFGGAADERTARVLGTASSERRTGLGLFALFYGNAPLVLGLVAMSAALQQAVARAGDTAGDPAMATLLAAGAALFLGGNAAVRRLLEIAPYRLRAAAAVAALASLAVGVTAGLEAQAVALAALIAAVLLAERHGAPDQATDPAAAPGQAAPDRVDTPDTAG
jgi:low temperature requirement protein LtrA